jgi:hypothetical protein
MPSELTLFIVGDALIAILVFAMVFRRSKRTFWTLRHLT